MTKSSLKIQRNVLYLQRLLRKWSLNRQLLFNYMNRDNL